MLSVADALKFRGSGAVRLVVAASGTLVVTAVTALLVACAGTGQNVDLSAPDAGEGTGSPANDALPGAPGRPPTDASLVTPGRLPTSQGAVDASNPSGCTPEATNYIYVATPANVLYKFNPSTLTFTMIGTMNCPGSAPGFTSALAIDQQGVAWVSYNTNGGGGTETGIYRVDTNDASCTATSYNPGVANVPGQWSLWDMSFSEDAVGSSTETLYVLAWNVDTGPYQLSLGSFDAAWNLTVLGPLAAPGCDGGACVAGPGFGQGNGLCLQGVGNTLYGLGVPYVASAWHDSTLAQFAKTGATVSSKQIDGVFADAVDFAFWGGKFWIFADDGGSSSNVNVYDPVTGAVTVVLTDIGFNVDVSSTSTCAPASTPK